MNNTGKLMKQVRMLLKHRGQNAFEMARGSVLQGEKDSQPVNVALRYFMEDFWFDVLHPALISIACDVVGGNSAATARLGASFAMLAGAADIHDDIIDQSVTKDSKPTVLGKFGKDIAILAGDALLVHGFTTLHEACEPLTKDQRVAIIDSIKRAFFEMSNAEARETSLRGRFDICSREYLNIIKMKAAAAGAATQVGAIFGGGARKDILRLGQYGRTLGTLMTIRDEFADIFDNRELENRVKHECLPLPILFSFKRTWNKDRIMHFLKTTPMTRKVAGQVVELVVESKEVRRLKRKMTAMIEHEQQKLKLFTRCVYELDLLLRSSIEDL
jgi:geranylgeranyl pyrophosphate synthase